MSRTKFDATRDQRIADEAIGPDDERLPCAFCSAPTARKTLSLLGARCGACYAAYCREAPSSGVASPRQVLAKLSKLGRIGVQQSADAETEARRIEEAKRLSAQRVAQYLGEGEDA